MKFVVEGLNMVRWMLMMALLFVLGAGVTAQSETKSEKDGEAKLLLREQFKDSDFLPAWKPESKVEDKLYGKDVPKFEKRTGHTGMAMHYYVPPGHDEVTPAQVLVSGRLFERIAGEKLADEIFVVWTDEFAKDYDWPDAQKVARFFGWYGSFVTHGCQLNVYVSDRGGSIDLQVHHPQDNEGKPFETVRQSGIAMPTGKPVTLAIHARQNSKGKADGFARVYLGDSNAKNVKLVCEITKLNSRGDDVRGWDGLWIGGNISSGGHKTQKPLNRWMSDIRWYSTAPKSFIDELAKSKK